MQTMGERQAFFCEYQVERVCFGEKLSSSGRDRCSWNKMCFEIPVPLSAQEYSSHTTLITVSSIVDESSCLTLSDDLAYFDELYPHQSIKADRWKFKYFPYFVYINAIRATTKFSFERTYHPFNFNNNILCSVLPFLQLFLVPVHNKILNKRSPSCGERHYQSTLMLGFVSSKGLN